MAKSQQEVDENLKKIKSKLKMTPEQKAILDGLNQSLQPFTKQIELQKMVANAISKEMEKTVPNIQNTLQNSLDILKPFIEEATKYHRLWLEGLATKSDDEIRKAIHDSLDVEKILEEEIDKSLSPEAQEEQRRLVLENIKDLEEDYFQEVLEIREKIQELTTEEEKELKIQLKNIQNPINTIIIKNSNVSNLFSQKEEKAPGEKFTLANTNISTIRTQDEDGNYQLQEVADFLIHYIFENGLQKGELSLKERLIFHNLVYYQFAFKEINQKVIHGTRKIPTIVPKETIARMIRGKSEGRIETNDLKLVEKVMKNFENMRMYYDYKDLKEKYKERFNEEIEFDEFELVGESEFASFVESELHKGISWKTEFAKYGIPIEDDGKKFDGYIIKKIPVFNAIKLQNQIGFIPFETNGYLSMNDTGMAINLEFQNLITSLDGFTRRQFTKMKDGSFGKIPISNKFNEKNRDEWKKNAIPEEEWELHKNDQTWKKNHFGFYLYYIEETIDTFFKHCYDLINNEKEALKFGRYTEQGRFVAMGSDKKINTERRKRNDQIKKMESYLEQAKRDGIIKQYEFIEDSKATSRQKPIYKVRIYKRKAS